MDESKSRYSGKRWVSKEAVENQGGTYEKKNTDTTKKAYSDGRKSRYTAEQADGNGKAGRYGRQSGDSYKAGYYTAEADGNGKVGRYGRQSGGSAGGNRGGAQKQTGDRYESSRERTDGYADKRDGYRSDRRAEGGKSYPRRKDSRATDAEKDRRSAEVTEEPAAQAGGADELPFLIIGRNAVREAVKSGRSIDKILVVPERDGSLSEIITLAKENKLVVKDAERKKLDELCMPFGHGGKTANHQGIVAYGAGMEYCSVSDILNVAKEKGEEPFVIVLDGVEDPHNLGSVIRSAECAGAHGVIIGKRRSASVTAAAVKAAAGATAYMKVARVTNISGALEELKRAGLWVAGADMDGRPMAEQGLNGALAIVIGGEGGGLTKLVRDTCDFLVSIPMYGSINSLNASVAAAVLMFEKKRQDAAQ